jgi:hypothetical protein
MAEDDLQAAARALAKQWWEPEKTNYCSTPMNYAIAEAASEQGFETEALYDRVQVEITKIRKAHGCMDVVARYRTLLRELQGMCDRGEGESEEAEALRDKMDNVWSSMHESQLDQIRGKKREA